MPSSAKKPPRSRKLVSKAAKSEQGRKQSRVDQRPLVCVVCGREYRTQRGLDRHVEAKHPPEKPSPIMETTVQAVERRLADMEDSTKHAVLIAQIRRVAHGLDHSDPTDRAKLSKELAERMQQLDAEANPADDDDDWTTGSGSPEVGDTPKPETGN
ncbi:MAG: hypothetical protein AAGA42_14350 [Actinomycetota bacterium]